MKAYRIKRREDRRTLYIPGEPVFYFKKPKMPLRFFHQVHPPGLYRGNPQWIIGSPSPVPEA